MTTKISHNVTTRALGPFSIVYGITTAQNRRYRAVSFHFNSWKLHMSAGFSWELSTPFTP